MRRCWFASALRVMPARMAAALGVSCSRPSGDKVDGLIPCDDDGRVATVGRVPARRRAEPEDSVADVVAALDDAAVRELVVAAAETHPDVERAVRLAVAGPSTRLGLLRAMVDDDLRTRRFLDWRQASEWAAEAQPAVRALADEVATQPSPELVELLERALGHVIKVILRADDSNGSIGDLTGQLLELHAVACDSGTTDPLRLAKWMIRFAFDDQDFFNLDPVRYAPALGESGLAAFRREVARRTSVKPDDYAARHAQERLAVLDRDVAGIVDLLGGDQTRPHQFIAVAEAMLELDLEDEALAWARRGIDETSGWQVAKLFEIAASINDRRRDLRAVLDLRREQLRSMPTAAHYALLRSAAEQCECWETERPTARALLAARDTGELVDALLADDDDDAAWATAQAAVGWEPGAGRRLRLAKARESSSPTEAAGAYLALVDIVLEKADRRAYQEAVRHLKAARRAAEIGGILPFFGAQMERLREQHKRRPTFIELLDKADLR